MYELDSLAFLLILFLTARSEKQGLKIPTILRTMAEDATRYFLVIFSAHLAFVLTLNLGRVSAAVFICLNCSPLHSIHPNRREYSSFQARESSSTDLNLTTLIAFWFTAISGVVV